MYPHLVVHEARVEGEGWVDNLFVVHEAGRQREGEHKTLHPVRLVGEVAVAVALKKDKRARVGGCGVFRKPEREKRESTSEC